MSMPRAPQTLTSTSAPERERARLLLAAFDASPDGVLVLDPAGRVV